MSEIEIYRTMYKEQRKIIRETEQKLAEETRRREATEASIELHQKTLNEINKKLDRLIRYEKENRRFYPVPYIYRSDEQGHIVLESKLPRPRK